jgi:hypothetical protein
MPARPAGVGRIPLALSAVVALAIAAGGCGGGSDETTAEAGAETTAEATAPTTPPEPEPGDGDFEGGEEQVEKSGSEAGGSERDAILAAEQDYLAALVSGDYRGACAHLSSSIEESLQAMIQGGKKPCAQILAHLVSASAAQGAKQQLDGKVVRVRVEGDHGFVIFHAPGARLYAFPMSREDGGWRVAALNGAVLAPSAATLGEG